MASLRSAGCPPFGVRLATAPALTSVEQRRANSHNEEY